mmetsp:Transcript_10753/g.19635  ORF Transcript_10753/g.19635 Transcript_10753/m.19635 type:complete len:246 (-) Transcript_10753:22-759(-)
MVHVTAAARAASRRVAHAAARASAATAQPCHARLVSVPGLGHPSLGPAAVLTSSWRSSTGASMLAALPVGCRAFASNAGAEGGKGSGESEAGSQQSGKSSQDADGKSESDRRYEEAGEYDTQDANRRVGNPIQWANPTGGGSMDDQSSNAWRWVFPGGIAIILLLALWSRRKALRAEREAEMIQTPDIRMPDTSNFKTPAYRPPPPSTLEMERPESQDHDAQRPPEWSSGGGGFSSPPPASTSNW